MARPFSYPEIPELTVGGSAAVYASRSEVRRKVELHAKRVGKEFAFYPGMDGHGHKFVSVVRLPDPEPEVA